MSDTERQPASEQTPLLRDASESNAQDTPLSDEPNTKELIWILGSIWLGVFLAALGKSGLRLIVGRKLIELNRRYNNCRYAVRAHLVLI
jgi:hypothetical protein